jgi:hypothetical protein
MSESDRWDDFTDDELLTYVAGRVPDIRYYIENADWRGGHLRADDLASAANEVLARFENYDR